MTSGIEKTIKGGRSAFFDDPEVDRLLAMLMRLMNHHWALYERVRLLESLLEANDLVAPGAVEQHQAGEALGQMLDQESYAFIKDVVESAQNIDNNPRAPRS